MAGSSEFLSATNAASTTTIELILGFPVSVSKLNEFLESEIDRVDDLFNELPSRRRSRMDDPLLESPGMAIIASRSHALRRELLAQIANRLFLETSHTQDPSAAPSLIVIPNQNPQSFIRQMLAVLGRLNFNALDEGVIEDEEWPMLTSAVNIISVSEESLQAYESWLRWETSPISLADLISLMAKARSGSTIILENYHQVQGILNHPDAIRELRCAAVTNETYLYVGGGLSHWHEVRTTSGVYLSDLAESLSESVHVADLITILAPEQARYPAVVFDPRYATPYRGSLVSL